MLNFAEQTGSGAVTVVWSFLTVEDELNIINLHITRKLAQNTTHKIKEQTNCDVFTEGLAVLDGNNPQQLTRVIVHSFCGEWNADVDRCGLIKVTSSKQNSKDQERGATSDKRR